MKFKLDRDADGNPVHVHTDDGFMQSSRKFDPEQDGWMEDQLDASEFPAIRTGRDIEWLVYEVNRLRRENFHMRRMADKSFGRLGTGART